MTDFNKENNRNEYQHEETGLSMIATPNKSEIDGQIAADKRYPHSGVIEFIDGFWRTIRIEQPPISEKGNAKASPGILIPLLPHNLPPYPFLIPQNTP